MNIALTPLQQDTLTEFFNIAMGRAASTLSRMVNEEVALSVPQMRFVQRSEAALLMGDGGERICSVMQTVRGDFDADALLIFPEMRSLELVRLMIGDVVPLEDITEMEQEALTEVGNIILNACIGTLANLLRGEFSIGLPLFRLGTCTDIFHGDRPEHDELVLLLHINFSVERYAIQGYVVFLQDVASFTGFTDSINRFLADAGAGA
ncbi:chemotaxis protein CheC [Chitiniphilus purpureus]|uniref:Chemotaxis protein CheC n=1 Tax=Chitiniphilus purpureus TaxID=2981137 RepID=A0ABY6DII7_9NEIS|nr:chemotaxis protein CheC [Chitiniphilus sp. CD1]UXY14152.1 chemotaxis protein CheC [Chitiniphilus sp. CD1]